MKRNFNRKRQMHGRGPNALFLLLVLMGMAIGYLFWYNSVTKERETIRYSTFLKQVDDNNVKSLLSADQHVQGELHRAISVERGGKVRHVTHFEATIVPSEKLWEKLHANQVVIDVYPQDRQGWGNYMSLFLFLPLLFLLFFLFLRQGQGGAGGGKIFNVGKSKARFFSPNTIKIKFEDVAGVQEAKEDLHDIVDFLKNPDKFKRIGAKIPRGVLLTGAPGNGKTMLAKAVAGEANCPFFSVNGSDFVEVFVGVGASRVRDLFIQARRHAPCIVFIDEIDAVGRHRGVGVGGGNDEREQTLNQLLSEMDGFSTEHGEVIVLAATNRPDVLDKALLRPGRFDRKVEVPYPDLVSREHILSIHSKNTKLDESVDLRKIARGTARFSGADLANLINEAALIASKRDKDRVAMDDFELARDKILVGAERTTLTRTAEEMRRTAYHEAGHTLVLVNLPHTQPLHKVTILSRGGALGITWYLPEGDEVSKSQEELLSEVMVCLGGRVAEEIVYGIPSRTTGAYSDLKTATKVIDDMVRLYGMSELGPITFHKQDGQRDYSESMAQKIDEQVSAIMHDAYEKTKQMLTEKQADLEKLAGALVEKETLEAREVYDMLGIAPRMSHSFREQKHPGDDQEDGTEHGQDTQKAAP